jgi:hypothetical protein
MKTGCPEHVNTDAPSIVVSPSFARESIVSKSPDSDNENRFIWLISLKNR